MNKTVNTLLRLAVAAALAIGFGKAYAFHSGGVAECGGCHSMHSPQDTALSQLLVATDQSSTCANASCHGSPGAGSYHVVTPNSALGAGQAPYNFTPGGDFGWLKKTYQWVVRNNTTIEHGEEHGHNIVAADLMYAPDGTGTSPGGSYPSAQLHCNSCHDQHGQARRNSSGNIVYPAIGSNIGPIIASGSYTNSRGNSATLPIPAGQNVGVYRLLRGQAATLPQVPAPVSFTGVPAAVAPSTYNRAENSFQTRVAYGVSATNGHATWGVWCGSCHGAMHSTGHYVHPVDQTMATLNVNYNNYVSSGDLSGQFTGDHANQGPFLSLAPFSSNTANYVTLGGLAGNAGGAANAGPTNGDQVNCLSCHRGHASAFPWMLRWQLEGEFITVADTATGTIPLWPGTDNGAGAQFARGRTEAEQRAGYYMRPATVFGVYNRVLCNKCHAKD